MADRRLFGLIGYPLSHSFSPGYFREKFRRENINAGYQAFELEDIAAFPELIKMHPELRGLNVTIPYKEQVFSFLDSATDDAREIGAVNCIDIRGGELTGHNTDVTGFEASLRPLLAAHHKNALLLGTGGSSKAVRFVLARLDIECTIISRSKEDFFLSYGQVDAAVIREHQLIINATPLGMSPGTAAYPDIPYEAITPDHLLYDLIYNPAETRFLSLGKARGAQVKNGLEMLELQAEASWKIWNS